MPSEVRFSRAQKWDLLRMSAAAIASTVFFTVPLFLVRPNPPAKPSAQPPATLPAPAVVPDVAASSTPATEIAPSPAPATEIAPSPAATKVSVVTSTEFAVASKPTLQPTRPRARVQRGPELRARANVGANPTQPTFKRRLVRFFSGIGKYAVKPFPTVNITGS
jgi:hypothetical protein